MFKMKQDIYLETDASDVGLGAQLMQIQRWYELSPRLDTRQLNNLTHNVCQSNRHIQHKKEI